MAFQSYRGLQVGNDSMDLVIEVYKVIEKFPANEDFALSSQLRRAVVSIPSNIAEGHGRTTADFARFLNISQGSLNEVGTQLEIAMRLNYISPDDFNRLEASINSISKMLYKLSATLSTKN